MESTLTKYREKLLDLGKRNKLLNLKSVRYENIELIYPDATTIFNKISEGNKLEFIDSDKALKDYLLNEEQEFSKTEYLEYLTSNCKVKNVIGYKSPLIVNRVLSNIMAKYKFGITEKGLNTLYLAAFTLSYQDLNDEKTVYKAPLLLIPISMQKGNKLKPYVIYEADDEIIVNPTLKYKLAAEYGIILPDYTDEDTVETFLTKVKTLITNNNWSLNDEIFIGHFSFLKMVMYEDLKENEDIVLANPLIKQILGHKGENEETPVNVVDNKDDFMTLHNVVDADGSQMEAIFAAKEGKSFILQGPPGTGKSQTITNLIAEYLYEGKRVLFISEKLAALSVVSNNLKKAGLGDFTLELHSHKTNKNEIINEFNRVLNLPSNYVTKDIDDKIDKLNEIKNKLDNYANKLHQKLDFIELTPYQLFSNEAKVHQAADIKKYLIKDIEKKNLNYLDKSLERFNRYLQYSKTIGKDYRNYEWYGYINKDNTYEHSVNFKNLLEIICQNIENRVSFSNLSSNFGVNIKTFDDVDLAIKFFQTLEKISFFTKKLFIKKEVSILKDHVIKLSSLNEKINNLHQEISLVFEDDIYFIAVEPIMKRFTKIYTNIFRIFNSQYRLDRNLLKLYLRNPKKKQRFNKVKTTLVKIVERNELLAEFNRIYQLVESDLGGCLTNLNTNWTPIVDSLNQIVQTYETIECNIKVDDLSSFNDLKADIKNLLTEYTDRIYLNVEDLACFKANYDLELYDINKVSLDDSYKKLIKCSESYNLNFWIQVLNLIDDFKKEDQLAFIHEIIELNLSLEEIENIYKKIYFKQMINHVINNVDELKNFDRADHDACVKAFIEYDHLKFEISKAEIITSLVKYRPNLQLSVAGSPASIIIKEASKKRKQMPIRTFFDKVEELTLRLKPCFLMSPLSVSTYLSSNIKFDVVIFDEASQIFPQDALVAIYRADQFIIVGDSKQMPPSNFFMSSILENDDYNEDEIEVDSFESILDVVLATGFPQYSLKWHYRSRNEDLITFSNHNFYKSSLVTFPSIAPDNDDNGVTFIYCNNGIYERKLGVNKNEAELVADIVYEHFKINPKRSIGVVAFNQNQQGLIEQVIQKRRDEHPEFESYFNECIDEPFFVKNLETVQGDERDTIVFSVGYGKDENGKFILNFGPLAKAGGERRLNVAITRAKFNVKLVSSIRYFDIDCERVTYDGPKLLSAYLEYAEKGNVDSSRNKTTNISKYSDIEFEQEILDYLSAQGYLVSSYVGTSIDKIDIAVKSKETNKYVIAIECDGPTYYHAKSSRDRDRLRKEVLERLGWSYYRIWSTEWFKNNKVEKEKLITAINTALNNESKQLVSKDNTSIKVTDFIETTVVKNELFPIYQDIDIVKLDSIKLNSSSRFALIYEIVTTLQPVHKDLLYKLMAKYYNRQKVTTVVIREIENEIETYGKKKVTLVGDFFFADAKLEIRLRIPKSQLEIRDIKFIHPKEIEDGILVILKENDSSSKDGLYKSLAAFMGYNHIGTAIISEFDKVFNDLISSNRIYYDIDDEVYKLSN